MWMARKLSSKGSKSPRPKSSTPASGSIPSVTPESFEKELQFLASKAQEETWGKWLAEQIQVYLRAAALVSLIALASRISQFNLSPVYGAIPASKWHDKLVMVACFVGWSHNVWLRRTLPVKPHHVLPVLALCIPVLQFYAFKISDWLGPVWGPLVTEGLTLFPLTSISVSCVANYIEAADLSGLPYWIGDSAPGLASFASLRVLERAFDRFLAHSMGRHILITRLWLEIIVAALYAAFAPSRLLLIGLPALLHTAVLNTHLATPMAFHSLDRSLNAHAWAILDRKESLTGYLSVLDNLNDGYRVLRCDHSLLGGEWTKYRTPGNQVAEPIYGVFTMLESVRLVEIPEKPADQEAKALVVGLGIGTTPAALVAHGIDTTIVEIDPVVYELAAKYFQLPPNHTAIIENAVSYTTRTAREGETHFDYIIHDVFTGGAEPVDLFTLEFLQDLDSLLKPNGVIGLNYAGDLTNPSPKIVMKTVRQVFPSCRIFREIPRDEAEAARQGRDFVNMVIFCTKLHTPITFRPVTPGDILNSPSRRSFLVPKHEVTDSDLLAGLTILDSDQDLGILTANNTKKVLQWHDKSTVGHWSIMRTVIPSTVWEHW